MEDFYYLSSRLIYKSTKVQTVWFWQERRHVDQWSWTESSEIDLQIYCSTAFLKKCYQLNDGKEIILRNSSGTTVHTYGWGMNFDPVSLYTQELEKDHRPKHKNQSHKTSRGKCMKKFS